MSVDIQRLNNKVFRLPKAGNKPRRSEKKEQLLRSRSSVEMKWALMERVKGILRLEQQMAW
jgi:hypothetical protein